MSRLNGLWRVVAAGLIVVTTSTIIGPIRKGGFEDGGVVYSDGGGCIEEFMKDYDFAMSVRDKSWNLRVASMMMSERYSGMNSGDREKVVDKMDDLSLRLEEAYGKNVADPFRESYE